MKETIFRIFVIVIIIPICMLLLVVSWIKHPIAMGIVTILCLLEECYFPIGIEGMGSMRIIPIYVGFAFCFTLI